MPNEFLDLCCLVGKFLMFYHGCKNNEILLRIHLCLIYYVNSDLNIWEGLFVSSQISQMLVLLNCLRNQCQMGWLETPLTELK